MICLKGSDQQRKGDGQMMGHKLWEKRGSNSMVIVVIYNSRQQKGGRAKDNGKT